MEFLTLLSAYPMGDDTPILLYAVLGIAALLLIVVSVIMGKKSKEHQNDKTDKKS